MLEGRCVPSTITPTTFADGVLGSGSLRDAVLQFNADGGTDDDTLQLLPGTYTLTIPNTSWHQSGGLDGDMYLTQTSHRWIIQGAGLSTVIDASGLQDRVFQIVNPGTQLVFQDLVIQGGLAQDDGTPGARPGTTDALGGGILNNGGNVTLDDVVVQNNVARGGDAAVRRETGYSARGGGIYSTGGALTIDGATVASNQAVGGRGGDSSQTYYPAGNGGSATGGGLYASSGSLDISHSSIFNNRATGGRGGDGGLYFTGTGFVYLGGSGGNAYGGGLYVNSGSLTVTSSSIASNQGTGGPGGQHGSDGASWAGAVYSNGTLTVSESTLSGNSAVTGGNGTHSGGGGIYNTGTLAVTGSTLSGNSAAPDGGGISNYGWLTVSDSTLSGNSASDNFGNGGSGGGGIYNQGTMTVTGSTLSGNSFNGSYLGNGGGGIYNQGSMTVTGSTLSGNSYNGSAYGSGGGIYNTGTLAVSNSTLSSNSAGNAGGGISNGGTLTVSNSTLSGNSTAFGSNEIGGGILNWRTLTVTGSTLSGNSAAYEGGGIFNLYGTLAVSNSNLSGNFARWGGGIYNSTILAQSLTLTNVTLTANRSDYDGGGSYYSGGGLYADTGELFTAPILHSTLIAGNFNHATGTRDDVYGRLDPGGDYNLIGDGTGMTGLSDGVNGNQVGRAAAPIDPLLGPLQDNGGPTWTHALLPGSPAIDAGNDAYATDWDQRGPGFPRISGPHIDIGAFEVQQGGGGSGADGGNIGGRQGSVFEAFLSADVLPTLAGLESFPLAGTSKTATSDLAESPVARCGAERETLDWVAATPAQVVDRLFAVRPDRPRAEEWANDLALA
jgi:hypothetical protein